MSIKRPIDRAIERIEKDLKDCTMHGVYNPNSRGLDLALKILKEEAEIEKLSSKYKCLHCKKQTEFVMGYYNSVGLMIGGCCRHCYEKEILPAPTPFGRIKNGMFYPYIPGETGKEGKRQKLRKNNE